MLLEVAFRNLFRNRRRTITLLLTISLGTASLFLFRGFNQGIMNQYRENTIRSRYGHGQINTLHYRDKVLEKPWLAWMDQIENLKKELIKIKGVQFFFPRIEFFSLLTNGRITVSGKGQGIEGESESQFFTTLNFIEGKPLSSEANGIVLGRGLAKALDAKLGDRITLLAPTIYGSQNGVDLNVVGIFHSGLKDFDDVFFRIPLKQAQMLLDTPKIESLCLGLSSHQIWPQVQNLVQSQFPHLEATPFEVLDKVYYQNSVDWLNSQFFVIQAIILTVVILGIFNSISTSILERKQEIGNLRANGESHGDILKLLTLEGAFLGLMGSFMGLLITCLTTYVFLYNGILMPPAPGITLQFHVFLELNAEMAFSCFLLGSFSALLGTWLAAYKVSQISIAESLRSL